MYAALAVEEKEVSGPDPAGVLDPGYVRSLRHHPLPRQLVAGGLSAV